MRIGELAEKAGVTPRTIRYYEELSLIRPLSHSEKGYRLYSEAALARLHFIRDLKDLDFSLEVIKSLIENMDSCETGRELAALLMPLFQVKRRKTYEKLNNYQKIRQEMMDYYQTLKTD